MLLDYKAHSKKKKKQTLETAECPSVRHWLNKLWYTHLIEYDIDADNEGLLYGLCTCFMESGLCYTFKFEGKLEDNVDYGPSFAPWK